MCQEEKHDTSNIDIQYPLQGWCYRSHKKMKPVNLLIIILSVTAAVSASNDLVEELSKQSEIGEQPDDDGDIVAGGAGAALGLSHEDEDASPSARGHNVELDPDDTPFMAESLGISLADARGMMGGQTRFSKLVGELHDDEDFLQSEMPSAPDSEYIIKYKNGNVPKTKQVIIDKFRAENSDMKVRIVASKFSMKDAEARGNRLTRRLEEKGYTNTGYAIRGDAIEMFANKSSKHAKGGGLMHWLTGLLGLPCCKVSKRRAAEIMELSSRENIDDAFGLTLVLFEFDGVDPAEPFDGCEEMPIGTADTC